MTGIRRLGVSALAVLLVGAVLAGCAQFDTFTYLADRYGRGGSVSVNLNCRDTYEVYDRPDGGTLLVITNPLNEVLVACLDSGAPDLATRQRQVARIFFDEKTNRPQCRITHEEALSERHREFSYTCLSAAELAPPKPVSARRR